jgi:hypothetical protein
MSSQQTQSARPHRCVACGAVGKPLYRPRTAAKVALIAGILLWLVAAPLAAPSYRNGLLLLGLFALMTALIIGYERRCRQCGST